MHPPLLPAPAAHHARLADVILLAGANGVGKTNVSYRLAHLLGMGVCEVDDLSLVLRHATTPAQQPAMHFYTQDPARFHALSDADKLAQMLAYSAELSPYISIVIANHLESGCPVVLEGDCILPALMQQPLCVDQPANGRVRGAVLVERDAAQILANYRQREGGQQEQRARSSWHHSQWLAASAATLGIPVVHARPWDSVLERLMAALVTTESP